MEICWNNNEDAQKSPVVSTSRQLPNLLKNKLVTFFLRHAVYVKYRAKICNYVFMVVTNAYCTVTIESGINTCA